jgi:hypothetical protein
MRFPACALCILVMTTPVFADPAGEFTRDRRTQNDPADGRADSLQGMSLDACVRLMQRVYYMDDPISVDRALDARRELELARDAFQDGDKSTCERHAVQALRDRI